MTTPDSRADDSAPPIQHAAGLEAAKKRFFDDVTHRRFMMAKEYTLMGGFEAGWNARDEEVARLSEQLRDALKLNHERTRCLDLEMQENKRLLEEVARLKDGTTCGYCDYDRSLGAENKQLREALEWYAAKLPHAVGDVARAALKDANGGSNG